MAGVASDGDGETGVGGDVEGGAAGDCFGFVSIVEDVTAIAADDFHQFGGFGIEVIFAGENHAERFGGSVG